MQEADRAIAKVAARQWGLITRAQATRLGATERMIAVRLRTGRWERVHRSVYRLAEYPMPWESEVMAACLLFGPQARASHRTAAALKRLGSATASSRIELTAPRGHARPRPGITLYSTAESLHPVDTEIVNGIPAISPARTLFDLAAVLPAHLVEEAIDDALVRRLVTPARLRWQLEKEARPGRKGTALMRALLPERGIGTSVHESVPEARLSRMLRRAGIHVEAQYEIREGGRFVARVDFAIPDLRIAIEVDGYRWHGGRVHWARDLARRNALTALGWQIIHVTPDDLENGARRIVDVLRDVISARGG